MPASVVDASAVAALLFGEPEGEPIARRLGRGPLVAPSLLRYEVASVCRKKTARHPTQRQALRRALGLLAEFDLEEVDVPVEALLEVAEASRLTVYDAAYLWLAQETGLPLVTLDRRLAAAARK